MSQEFKQTFHTGIYNYYASYIALFGASVADFAEMDYRAFFNIDDVITREGDIVCTVESNWAWTYRDSMSLQDFFKAYRKEFWYRHVPSEKGKKYFNYDEGKMYTSYTDEELNSLENMDRTPEGIAVTKIEALAFLYQFTGLGKELYLERYGVKYEPVWTKVVGRPYNPIEIGAMKELKEQADAVATAYQVEINEAKKQRDKEVEALEKELQKFQEQIDRKKNDFDARLSNSLMNLEDYYMGMIKDIVKKMKDVTGEVEIPVNAWMRY